MTAGKITLDSNRPCDIVITPAQLSGSIPAISSKSYAQRAYIAAALADKPTMIVRADDSLSNDMLVALSALKTMGADYKHSPHFDTVTPISTSATLSTQVNCGESGTVARLLLPVVTALFDHGTLTGEGSLLTRPFETLCKTLERAGKTSFDQYNLPISWSGRLQPGHFKLPGDESSQYLSGLLFALPLLPGNSTIELTSPLQSVGYVDMTLDVLRKFGISIRYDGVNTYHIAGNQQYVSPGTIAVEGDWSNSAFWLATDVEVTGLNYNSLQRDRSFIHIKDQSVIDATDIPDLVPILSVIAARRQRTGKGMMMTCIRGIKRLRLKESDRIETTLAMLKALGCKAMLCPTDDDKIYVFSTGTIPGGGVVDGANDHRIVMAAAIAASFAEEPVTIQGAHAVAKTYAHFFEDFEQLGGIAHVV